MVFIHWHDEKATAKYHFRLGGMVICPKVFIVCCLFWFFINMNSTIVFNNRDCIPNHLITQADDYLPADPVMLVSRDMMTFNIFVSSGL
jgi:hypothetical protein